MVMKQLPTSVQSLFTASTLINSYKKAIEELVYNAIDANSTSIAIRLHVQKSSIQVIDNGDGISEHDMKNVGKRYFTSKTTDLQTLKSVPNCYGYRGQTLACIIEISQDVTITSRAQNTKETWLIKFHKKKEDKLAPSITRPSKGTTVEIQGFLYNLKIQNKLVNPLTEIQNIKQFLQRLSLVHKNISISLRDDSKNEIIFQLHKSRDIYQIFSTVLSIAKEEIQELQVEKNTYKVHAYIGKKVSDSKEHHWIYLNGRFIPFCSLHKIFNKYVTKHMCLKKQKKISKTNALFSDVYGTNFNKNISLYFLFITCPYNDYDIISTIKPFTINFKKWNEIKNLLEKLVKFFIGDDILSKDKKRSENSNKISESNDKIKEIMEKILGSTKKIGISQMQNGIKGKIIKKKNKSKSKNLSNKSVNIIPHSSHKLCKTGSEVKLLNNLDKVEVISEHNQQLTKNDTKLVGIQSEENIDLIEAADIRNNKAKSESKKCRKKRRSKLQTKTNNIPLKTAKAKESKEIITNLLTEKNLFELKLFSERKKNSTPHPFKVPQPHAFQNQKSESPAAINKNHRHDKIKMHYKLDDLIKKYVLKRINDKQYTYSHDLVQTVLTNQPAEIMNVDFSLQAINSTFHLPTFSVNIGNELNDKQFKSSRNLLQTILRSQLNYAREQIYTQQLRLPISNHTNVAPEELVYNDLPAVKEDLKYPNESYNTKLTYESHTYSKYVEANSSPSDNLCSINKLQTKCNFFTKESRDNFGLSKRTLKKSLKSKFYTRKPMQINRKSFKESSYSIQFSESIDYHLRNDKCDAYPEVVINPTYNLDKITDDKAITEDDNYNKTNTLKTRSNRTHHIDENKFYFTKKNIVTNGKGDESFNQSLIPAVSNYDISVNVQSCEHRTLQNNINEVFVSTSRDDCSQVEKLIEKDIDPVNLCEIVLNSSKITDSLNNMETNLCHIPIPPPDNEIYSLPSDAMATYNAVIETSHHLENNSSVIDISRNLNKNLNKTHFYEKTLDNEGILLNDHVSTGIISQNVNKKHDFTLKNRLRFIPKGMSPIFENCNIRNNNIYNFEEYFNNNMYTDFIKAVDTNTEIFQADINNMNNAVTKEISKVKDKLKKDNASLHFNGQNIKDAKVLGQVDNKFIAVKMRGNSGRGTQKYLILFDQHAVHERVRLETNLAEYLQIDYWNSIMLDDVTIKIKPDEILYLHNYKEKFEQLGLKWTVIDKNVISVIGIPYAILGKHVRQVDIIMKAVKNLISEQTEVLTIQKGSISIYPKSIMNLVFSEACRYAIKFGDKLSTEECVRLLAELAECKTPFQCAHGRPVMTVITDIQKNDKSYKINYNNVMEFKRRMEKKQALRSLTENSHEY